MSDLHVIFGTGPVGCWTARKLVERGVPVRAVNRSGKRPELLPETVELVVADGSDPAQAIEAARGAAVVYQAMNPPYDKWAQLFPGVQAGAIAAAKAAGATLVSVENLYLYDSSKPMTEDSPIAPVSGKGRVRAAMSAELDALRESGELRVIQLRSSDYYGPGVSNSAVSEMLFGAIVAGKRPTVLGSRSVPHSVAYIEDVATAAASLGTSTQDRSGVWLSPHNPAISQGELVARACRIAGVEARTAVISPLMMRFAGLFNSTARESFEMLYEFTKPFVVDSSRIESELGIEPTPLDESLTRTLDWYRTRPTTS